MAESAFPSVLTGLWAALSTGAVSDKEPHL